MRNSRQGRAALERPPDPVRQNPPSPPYRRSRTAATISATASSTGTPFFCSPLR